jgi:phosphate transport system permease protein
MATATVAPHPREVVRPPKERTTSWPIADRLAYSLCWAVGIALCLITAAIVLYFLVKGISYFSIKLFTEHPAATLTQSQSGGFLDPLIGTLVVTVVGTIVAAPVGVAIAVWLTEYGRPTWLARAVESAVEMVAGAPSVVLAIFGLLIFAQGFLSFLSQGAAHGALGESFLIAGMIMSLLALPLVVVATREGLDDLPSRLREGSYALGKSRITTIRTVLLPTVRANIATGVVLGMGRIIGDTAIVGILLGGNLTNQPVGTTPLLGLLKGTGTTMTYYVYYNSPAGEGNAHEKAYVAAFVLIVMILGLNALVTRLARGSSGRRPFARLFEILSPAPNR